MFSFSSQRKASPRRPVTSRLAGTRSCGLFKLRRVAGTDRKNNQRKRLGATLVEFAIVSNVLLITIFTCMEFARMNMARNLMQDAAYYAARKAIVPGATATEAEAEADRIMGSIFSNGYTVSCTPISDEAESVTVTVGVNMDEIALFVPMFLGGIELNSVATMKTERYSGYYEQ
ncbi:TadE-like protein [Neorhodopirellula lusitana]|uniref:TadE-like protein n=1 Tax=Neorhodopirellula lusitana TaxID=445327 RepID=A0ABY1Q0B1_9BACT|nr:TadE family protein [Neorhodopirellula lusitana]SMP53787.1 TadE-like protein [Neorhodopirellula lusitana]